MKRDPRLWEALAVMTVILLAGWAMVASAQRKNAATDEAEQLWAGYVMLRRGDYSINPHPPLTKLLHAIPLYFLGADIPQDHRPQPTFSDLPGGRRFLYQNGVGHQRMLTAGRLVNIGLALAFMLCGYLLARRMYGVAGGALTLGVLALSPNLAAHARLATTDLGATALPVVSLALLGWALEVPTRRRLALAGLAIGLGLGTKLSAIYLVAVVLICTVLADERGWVGGLRRAVGVLGVAVATLAALYSVAHLGDYLRGFFLVTGNRWGQPFYLMGEICTDGWWRHNVIVLGVKLPHAHQVLTGAVIVSLFLWRPKPAELPLAVGAGFVLVGLLVTPIHFGARHALPAICMLGLLSGRLIKQRPRWAIPLVFSLVIGSGLGMVRCWPHYLAYCNELAGGPSEGHRILIDTNLDMGQDLAELARWVERKKLPVIYLCYFGSGDPRAHGIPYRWVPDDRNAHLSPGYPVPARLARRFLAISVMNLYLHHDRGFSWLTRRKPVATMGHTILVFDITRDAEAAERLSTIYAAGGYREQADYELRRSQQLKNRRGR